MKKINIISFLTFSISILLIIYWFFGLKTNADDLIFNPSIVWSYNVNSPFLMQSKNWWWISVFPFSDSFTWSKYNYYFDKYQKYNSSGSVLGFYDFDYNDFVWSYSFSQKHNYNFYTKFVDNNEWYEYLLYRHSYQANEYCIWIIVSSINYWKVWQTKYCWPSNFLNYASIPYKITLSQYADQTIPVMAIKTSTWTLALTFRSPREYDWEWWFISYWIEPKIEILSSSVYDDMVLSPLNSTFQLNSNNWFSPNSYLINSSKLWGWYNTLVYSAWNKIYSYAIDPFDLSFTTYTSDLWFTNTVNSVSSINPLSYLVSWFNWTNVYRDFFYNSSKNWTTLVNKFYTYYCNPQLWSSWKCFYTDIFSLQYRNVLETRSLIYYNTDDWYSTIYSNWWNIYRVWWTNPFEPGSSPPYNSSSWSTIINQWNLNNNVNNNYNSPINNINITNTWSSWLSEDDKWFFWSIFWSLSIFGDINNSIKWLFWFWGSWSLDNSFTWSDLSEVWTWSTDWLWFDEIWSTIWDWLWTYSWWITWMWTWTFNWVIVENSLRKTCKMFNLDWSFAYNSNKNYQFILKLDDTWITVLDSVLFLPQKFIDFLTNPINNVISIFSTFWTFPDDTEVCFIWIIQTVQYQKYMNYWTWWIIKPLQSYAIQKWTPNFIDYFVLLWFWIFLLFVWLIILKPN